MPRTALRDYVDGILAAPTSLDALHQRIAELEGELGSAPEAEDVDQVVQLSLDYVEAVIVMIDDSDDAGAQRGLQRFTAPLVAVARGYFLDPEDLIPDSAGLYGLMDDAYLAHCFVIRISEMVQAERGFPLLTDLNPELLPVIRGLLGEEITAQLDAKIEEALESVRVRNHLANLAMLTGTLPNGALEEWRKVAEDKKRMRWAPGA